MKSFFIYATLLFAYSLQAEIVVKENTLTKAQIVPNASVQAEGANYTSPTPENIEQRKWWMESSYGLVKLSYKIAPSGSRPTGTATVYIKIEYHKEKNDGTYGIDTLSKVLTVTLANETAHNIAYFKAEGAQFIKATIKSNGTSIPTDFVDLTLSASVETNSFLKLDRQTDVIVKNALGLSHTLTSNRDLKINWSALPGAETYQLEWTYLSDQHPDNKGARLPASEIEVDPLIFKNNSSRVEVKGTSYEIPMVYEKGIILYRARGVGKNVSNSKSMPSFSEWTVPDGTISNAGSFPNSYTYDGHEEDLNWQSSLSLAEEGKKKVIISYHDGTSRNRQAVTRINSDQRSVVGEHFYDFEGRSVIQLLPVPVKQNVLSFYPQFNLIEGQSKVEKAAYDKGKEGSGTGCEVISPVFDMSSGASRYYSPNNDFSTNGNVGDNLISKNLIPSAEKYPYSQIVYTPDNTKKIAATSGLGPAYRIGQHDTRYIYGTPSQQELSRLFGTQIGSSAHYKKNLTIDPNGQTSVSYLDMNGKIIATALTGAKPDNLTALDENSAKTISAQLIEEATNTLSEDKLSLVLSKKFVVSGMTSYLFKYNGNIGTFNLQCSNSSAQQPINFNFKGATSFKVSLLDRCKTPLFLQTGCTACASNTSTSISMPVQNLTLSPGEYQISKTLKIDEAALDKYFQEYVNATNTCVLVKDSFLFAERKKVDIIGCGLTCQQCRDQIQKIIDASQGITSQEKQMLFSSCNSLCNDEAINCRSALEAMRGDMAPGGQYGQLRKEKLNTPNVPEAKLDDNNQPNVPETDVTIEKKGDDNLDAGDSYDNKITVGDFPLSIYNENNSLTVPHYLQKTSIKAYYKYPVAISKPGFPNLGTNNILDSSNQNLTDSTITYSLTDYKDQQGNTVYVTIYLVKDKDGNNAYLPKIDAEGLSILQTVDAEKGIYKVPVRHLDSLQLFERHWQNHWANYLVPYHPEYGYLKQCTSEKTSHDFDYRIINASTYNLAKQAGFIDGNDGADVLGKDAFVQSDPKLKSKMTERNTLYQKMKVDSEDKWRTMAEAATITVNCPRLQTACGNANCADGKLNTDEEWTAYKAFYFAEKYKLMKEKATKIAVDSFYYNGCIGHSDFQQHQEASYFNKPVIITKPLIVYGRYCNTVWQNNYTRSGYTCYGGNYTIFQNELLFPIYNPAQVCFDKKYKYYDKKTQRFYPLISNGIGGGEIVENCTTFVQGPNNESVEVTFTCENDAKEIFDNATEDAQRSKYSTCGLCPLASDLNDFILLLKKNNALVSTQPLIVSCDQHAVRLGEVLRTELNSRSSLSSPPFYWKTTVSGNRLTGEFSDGNVVLAKLELAIPNGYDNRVNFTNLGKLCCLNTVALGENIIFPFETGKIFSLLAVNTFTNQKFRLEGRFDIPLFPCNIPPKCLTTDDASRIVLFLNALSSFTPSLPSKSKVLFTDNSTIDLLRISTQTVVNQLLLNFYSSPIRVILRKDSEETRDGYVSDIVPLHPTWASSVQPNGTFEGVLNHTNGSIVIQITGLDGNEYALVEEIYHLRPNKLEIQSDLNCQANDCLKHSFLADVKLVENNQIERKTVTITVPSMNPVSCTAAKKALIK